MTNTDELSTTSKKPTHVAYVVRNRDGMPSIWTRIGSAWAHRDSNGFNIQLESLPIDGRISLRVAAEKQD